MKKSKGKRKRTIIPCPLYRLSWFVQRGGKLQEAADWYASKIQVKSLEIEDSELHLGNFSYYEGARDALIWYREDVGTTTIVHEVMHAIVYLANLLDSRIETMTDEIFAHYSGWLSGEIVRKLWN